MVDLEKLDAYLSSEASPEYCMMLSDLDGFLTGVLCSPDLIRPSDWLPVVWRSKEPKVANPDQHSWASQAILERYNAIASFLNNDPPYIQPIFWHAQGGDVIAMDWCEGFVEAYELRQGGWRELLAIPEGQEWMAPIFAHVFLKERETQSTDLDNAAKKIPEVIPKIFTYWKVQRSSQS